MTEAVQDEETQACGTAGTNPSLEKSPKRRAAPTFDEYGNEASLEKRGKKRESTAPRTSSANEHARCQSTSAKGRAANLEMQQSRFGFGAKRHARD